MTIIQIGSYSLTKDRIDGGVEASIQGLVNELKIEHKVIIFDLPRHNIESDYIDIWDNLPIYRFASLSSNNFGALKRAKEYAKKIKLLKPDICHIHGTGYMQIIVYLFLRKLKFPVILTVHGLQHIEKRNEWINKKTFKSLLKYLLLSFCEFAIITLAPLIIVDTQYVKNELLKYKRSGKVFRLPEIKVIPQGINSIYFNLKDNFNINNTLLSVGALNKRKGHLELINALSLVKAKITELKVYIVGFISDFEYYEELKKRINELHLDDNVFVCTNVSNIELLDYYKKSCIFVLHSKEESQGIVLCEAMACGMPIICTNSGGIPDVVSENLNGLLSDFGDVETFANNIVKVLTNNELYDKILANNKQTSFKYNWKVISAEVLKSYTEVVKSYK